jgi:hypothetical protein
MTTTPKPKPLKLSGMQRALFLAVGKVSRQAPDAWYRAGDAKLGHCRGEAVTLSSLHRIHLLERRLRPKDGHAFEYRLHTDVLRAVNETVAEKSPPAAAPPLPVR